MFSLKKILWIALLAAPLVSALAAGEEPDRAHRELVDLISPRKEIDYETNRVEAKFELSRRAQQKTLTVVLNGKDITKRFKNEDDDHSWDRREKLFAADLRKLDGLRSGSNSLIVHVYSDSGRESLVNRRFFVTAHSGLGDVPLTSPPSSVSISTSVIDPSNTASLSSYSIVVNGERYSPGDSNSGSCPSGTTSNAGMQVLVLNRQTLQKVDYQCFDTSTSSASFETYLSTLSNSQQPELVIASSFLKASGPGLSINTNAIGGSFYPCVPNFLCLTPAVYSTIGVPGLPAGQAYETSLGATPIPGAPYYATLAGVLVKDTFNNYNFVPNAIGAFVRFKATPGDAAGDPASVQIGDTSGPTIISPPALPPNWAGGYWLLLMHRFDLTQVVSSTLYATNSSTALQDSLASALTSAPADNLIILTSLPSPSGAAPAVPTANLKAAIDSLGGSGYALESTGGPGFAYTLLSTTDPRVARTEAIVSSSKYAAQGESGVISGVLARAHSNLYVPVASVQDKSRAADDETDVLQYELYNILAQPSTAFPLPSTAGQWAAYAYLSKQITANFGCNSGTNCSDYRFYYTITDTQSNFCSTDPSSFSPVSLNGFTMGDYIAVQSQLHTEKIDVCNILDLHTNLTTLFLQENSNVGLLLNTAGAEVADVNPPDSNAATILNTNRFTNLALNLAKLIPVPGVPQVVGLTQAFFQFGMTYESSAATNLVPTAQLNLTAGQLASSKVSQYFTLQSGTDVAFESILQDWGKLSVIGSNIGNAAPGYAWQVEGPANILAAFNLRTRTEFYNALLPVVYSVDSWHRLTDYDPNKLGYWQSYCSQYGCNSSCVASYGDRAGGSFVAYKNLSSTSTWDTFVITTTNHGSDPGFPSWNLVNNVLFGAPASDGTGGLNLVKDLFFSTNSALPARYAINTFIDGQNCGCNPPNAFSEKGNACTSNF